MKDTHPFNVRSECGHYLCPVCGFCDLRKVPPYYPNGAGVTGSGICPCCLWDPGYSDCPHACQKAQPTVMQSITAYRTEWLRTMAWRGKPERKPRRYNPLHQIHDLRMKAPDLFPQT